MSRVYKVTSAHKEHLVIATTQAQALRHVAGKYYTIEVASTLDVAKLMGKGIQVEDAIPPMGQDQESLETGE